MEDIRIIMVVVVVVKDEIVIPADPEVGDDVQEGSGCGQKVLNNV